MWSKLLYAAVAQLVADGVGAISRRLQRKPRLPPVDHQQAQAPAPVLPKEAEEYAEELRKHRETENRADNRFP